MPDREILVAESTGDVVKALRSISDHDRVQMAERARMTVLSKHTGAHRAHELETYFMEAAEKSGKAAQSAVPRPL